ncbi:transmembrane protein 237A-like isoform X2 [Corythoichthys intestinalis]|uniref:transmembrane protein 237A-like isoform X2 n=1 Tax=Corythoichthys intestinalis TaxID=161448 RepID=UPI0025A5249E|nr:transmembrane protein 237A-like isoform X2 [Corythoichthys intestinalis]
MDNGLSKPTRPRELPPLPQRVQRKLSSGQSDDAAEVRKVKKKRVKKQTTETDDTDDQGMEMEGRGSRQTFQIKEQLSLDATTDAPPQRKKKKKKTPTIPSDLEDDQADLVNGDTVDQTTDEELVKKNKKKKKSKVGESSLPDELDVEEDDIITDMSSYKPQHSLFTAPQGQSQPVGKIFVERSKRFQAAEWSNRRKTSDQMENLNDFHPMQPCWTTRDVSLMVHEGFRIFALHCQGFLAGFAVWNIVVVFMLAGQHLTAISNLLEQYQSLAYPSQSLLYMLLAISTVAAFDRVNLAKSSMALQELITLDPVALASLLYFSALLLSLSQQMTSDRINLYPDTNETLWLPGSKHQILHSWVTVNLVVALLVGLAWIFIVIRPQRDNTESYLTAMRVEPPKTDDNLQISA